MPNVRTSLLPILLAVSATLLAACPRENAPAPAPAPPPPDRLVLQTAAQARANLIVAATIPNPDGLISEIGALAKKLGLPFGEAEARGFLDGQLGAGKALLARVDTGKAIGLASVAGKAQGSPTAIAFALKDASPAGFAALVAAAGRVLERKNDAVSVSAGDAGGAIGWLVPRDGAVVIAESLDALQGAGGAALAARAAATTDDVHFVLYPEGIARSAGTDLKTALATARTQIAAAQATMRQSGMMPGAKPVTQGGDPRMAAGIDEMSQKILGTFFDAIGDTDEARVGFSLDPAKGLATSFALVPRAKSAFAARVAPRQAYVVEPGLLVGEPPAGLWAMGDTAFLREMMQIVRTTLIEGVLEGPERDATTKAFDTMAAALAGPWSAAFRFSGGAKPALAYDIIYQLKRGADGRAVLDTIMAAVKNPALGRLMDASSQGMFAVKIGARRDGEDVIVSTTFNTSKMPAQMRATWKSIPFLGAPMEARSAVQGERLMVVVGPDHKRRMDALRAPPAGPPATGGDVGQAIADTKGEDGLYYLDLGALMRPILASMDAAAKTGKGAADPLAVFRAEAGLLAKARLAGYCSYRGGNALTFTCRTPLSTFESVAEVVRGAMGAMGGMAPGTGHGASLPSTPDMPIQ